jgi:hypothetical protein
MWLSHVPLGNDRVSVDFSRAGDGVNLMLSRDVEEECGLENAQRPEALRFLRYILFAITAGDAALYTVTHITSGDLF